MCVCVRVLFFVLHASISIGKIGKRREKHPYKVVFRWSERWTGSPLAAEHLHNISGSWMSGAVVSPAHTMTATF